MRSTHTYAELEVSELVYDEIRRKLEAAGYDHALQDGTIDMHGIGLVKMSRERDTSQVEPLPGEVLSVTQAREKLDIGPVDLELP